MRYVFETETAERIADKSPLRQRLGDALRREICDRNLSWARHHRFAHEVSFGSSPTVLYRDDDAGRHGNFYPASYTCIRRNPEWQDRLKKTHTTSTRILASHERRCELDSCNSSDALLMSVFCHPPNLRPGSDLRVLLGVNGDEPLVFGYKPHIPLKQGRVDTTEIDLRVGSLFIEAKLTENDFQTARQTLVERYRDLAEVFSIEDLPRSGNRWFSYQLVRGALAAHSAEGARFCVLCDARRTDLIADWYSVLRCVRDPDLRCRLTLITWQEIAAVCPRPLRVWLSEKYGIIPEQEPVGASGVAQAR